MTKAEMPASLWDCIVDLDCENGKIFASATSRHTGLPGRADGTASSWVEVKHDRHEDGPLGNLDIWLASSRRPNNIRGAVAPRGDEAEKSIQLVDECEEEEPENILINNSKRRKIHDGRKSQAMNRRAEFQTETICESAAGFIPDTPPRFAPQERAESAEESCIAPSFRLNFMDKEDAGDVGKPPTFLTVDENQELPLSPSVTTVIGLEKCRVDTVLKRLRKNAVEPENCEFFLASSNPPTAVSQDFAGEPLYTSPQAVPVDGHASSNISRHHSQVEVEVSSIQQSSPDAHRGFVKQSVSSQLADVKAEPLTAASSPMGWASKNAPFFRKYDEESFAADPRCPAGSSVKDVPMVEQAGSANLMEEDIASPRSQDTATQQQSTTDESPPEGFASCPICTLFVKFEEMSAHIDEDLAQQAAGDIERERPAPQRRSTTRGQKRASSSHFGASLPAATDAFPDDICDDIVSASDNEDRLQEGEGSAPLYCEGKDDCEAEEIDDGQEHFDEDQETMSQDFSDKENHRFNDSSRVSLSNFRPLNDPSVQASGIDFQKQFMVDAPSSGRARNQNNSWRSGQDSSRSRRRGRSRGGRYASRGRKRSARGSAKKSRGGGNKLRGQSRPVGREDRNSTRTTVGSDRGGVHAACAAAATQRAKEVRPAALRSSAKGLHVIGGSAEDATPVWSPGNRGKNARTGAGSARPAVGAKSRPISEPQLPLSWNVIDDDIEELGGAGASWEGRGSMSFGRML